MVLLLSKVPSSHYSPALFFSRPKRKAPVISKDDVIKEGWLDKQSMLLHGKEWKSRWCVLTPHFLLSYESKTSTFRNPTVFLRISKCCQPLAADAETARQFSFKVSARNRTFFLVASSDEERHSWINCISQQQTFRWEPIVKGAVLPKRTVQDISESCREAVHVARNSKRECGKMTSRDGRACQILSHHGGSSDRGDVLVTHEDAEVKWVSIKRGDLLPPAAVFAGYTMTDGDVYVARNAQGEFGKLNLIRGSAWSIWCHKGGKTREGEVLCISLHRAQTRSSGARLVLNYRMGKLALDYRQAGIVKPHESKDVKGVEQVVHEEEASDVSPASRSSSAASTDFEDPWTFLEALEPKVDDSELLQIWRDTMGQYASKGKQADFYCTPPRVAELGSGSFGKVWLARHRHTSELFAVKNMETHGKFVKEAVARNELRVAERISEQPHPCIVSLFLVDQFQLSKGGQLYMLVMEYCQGGDLLKKIRNSINAVAGTYSPPSDILMWMVHVFLALEHLHLTVQSLVRDLKPANVVVSESGVAKLTDFGCGKLFTESPGTWSYGCPPGSPGYAAPEVLLQQPYDTSADFYSFGATMWVAFSGGWCGTFEPAPPLSGNYPEDWQKLARALEKPRMGRRTISAEARELISFLTQREPGNRPSHAQIRQSRLFSQLELPEQGTAASAPGVIEAWQPPADI